MCAQFIGGMLVTRRPGKRKWRHRILDIYRTFRGNQVVWYFTWSLKHARIVGVSSCLGCWLPRLIPPLLATVPWPTHQGAQGIMVRLLSAPDSLKFTTMVSEANGAWSFRRHLECLTMCVEIWRHLFLYFLFRTWPVWKCPNCFDCIKIQSYHE